MLEENGAEAFLFGERGRFAPQGVAGGAEGAMNVFHYQQGDAWETPPLASKIRGIKLKQGEAVRLETPGGGGYGAPTDRAPAAVARDVAQGFLSEDEATRLYGSAWQEVAR